MSSPDSGITLAPRAGPRAAAPSLSDLIFYMSKIESVQAYGSRLPSSQRWKDAMSGYKAKLSDTPTGWVELLTSPPSLCDNGWWDALQNELVSNSLQEASPFLVLKKLELLVRSWRLPLAPFLFAVCDIADKIQAEPIRKLPPTLLLQLAKHVFSMPQLPACRIDEADYIKALQRTAPLAAVGKQSYVSLVNLLKQLVLCPQDSPVMCAHNKSFAVAARRVDEQIAKDPMLRDAGRPAAWEAKWAAKKQTAERETEHWLNKKRVFVADVIERAVTAHQVAQLQQAPRFTFRIAHPDDMAAHDAFIAARYTPIKDARRALVAKVKAKRMAARARSAATAAASAVQSDRRSNSPAPPAKRSRQHHPDAETATAVAHPASNRRMSAEEWERLQEMRLHQDCIEEVLAERAEARALERYCERGY